MQFNQHSVVPEGINELVSENEKKERIQKALDIHMLQNREAHMAPPGQTLFSFTQGDPNAVIGKVHGFGEAIGSSNEEKKQASIEQQRLQQQQEQWQSSGHKADAAPVRTCPCCVRFLQDTFHMNEKEASSFAMGAESGPVTYGGATASEGYNANSPSGEYSSNASGGNYSSSSGSYSGRGPMDDENDPKYMGQRNDYEP